MIWGKELTSLGRLLPIPPRGQVFKFKEQDCPSGELACVRLTRPRGPEAGAQRTACTSLPALPLAPGCCRGKSLLLAASFRLSGESVNSTFLISESLEKRHSTAAGCTPGRRAPAPRAGRERPPAAAESSGHGRGRGEMREDGGERGTKSKDPVRRKSGGHSVSPIFWPPGAGCVLSPRHPGCQRLWKGKSRPGASGRGERLPPYPQPYHRRGRWPPGPYFLPALASPSKKRPMPRSHCGADAPSPPSRGAISRRGTGKDKQSYLIAHTPTLVCGSWSPFPVVCKTEEKNGCEKRRSAGAQGSKEAPWGSRDFDIR